jgi:hypothetical protein
MAGLTRAAGRIGASALLVAAATLGTITAASAAPGVGAVPTTPGDCLVSPSSGHVTVICGSGTGEYRASTRCDVNNWPDYNRYGAWVTRGHTSNAICDRGDRAFNQGFQTR